MAIIKQNTGNINKLITRSLKGYVKSVPRAFIHMIYFFSNFFLLSSKVRKKLSYISSATG